ncbi:MAG: M20/M25/M40 family metallo-hydrolase [Candidatus Helarchaeota archaeon]
MNDDKVGFLKKIVEIYSPSGRESELADFLKKSMEYFGFTVWIDPVGNIIGEVGSGTPVILFATHIDTVPGKIPINIKNGKLYGRGSVDAKGSCAAMILAISQFVKKEIKGKIIFAGIVEEELTLKGVEQLIKNRFKVDYGIFGEPGWSDKIGVAYKGRLGIKFLVQSKRNKGHVASSWLYINAIEEALQFWYDMKKLFVDKYKGKSPFFSVIPNLTIVSGGTAINVVPDTCSMNIDIRFPPGISSNKLIQEIDLLIKKVENSKEIKITYEIMNQIEAYRADRKSIIVQTAIKAISEVLKKEAKVLRKTGTCMMNKIGVELGITMISYGPGDPKLEHTDNESIDIKDYMASIKVYTRIIELLLETNK